MSVLLGVCDENISQDNVSWDVNKIGGIPDWLNKEILVPRCKKCLSPLVLVTQTYCPLERSPYHRVLYVFGCLTRTCWTQSESWQAMRVQKLDKTSGDTTQTSPAPPSVCTQEVKQVADGWGEEDDDWGDADCHENLLTDIISGSTDTNATSECLAEPQTLNSVANEPASEADIDEEDVVDCVGLNVSDQIIVEDASIQDPSESVLYSLVTNVDHNDRDTKSADDMEQQNVLTERSDTKLVSYYIDVFEESECEATHKDIKKEYKELQSAFMEDRTSRSKGKSESGEAYEKTILPHSDKTFYKFQKRIAPCPQQILRYQHKGCPLQLSDTLGPVQQYVCSSCGARAVFELQLMPTLVSMLKTGSHSHNGAAIEFGTVLVFTCERSCWDQEAVYRLETVVVQADADHALFRS